MKVTKNMLDRADDAHFRTETYPSLIKAHALAYLYYKQRGNIRMANRYISNEKGDEVRKKVKQLETARPVRKRIVRRKPTMFTPTKNWGI